MGATPKWREARTRERVQGDRDLSDEAKARKIAEAEETYAPRIGPKRPFVDLTRSWGCRTGRGRGSLIPRTSENPTSTTFVNKSVDVRSSWQRPYPVTHET